MDEPEEKYALLCEEMFTIDVQGYEVGTNTRMVKAQLSEVKDLPVEGDVEVWANRAEGRAVFTSADVEADVKLEDEHDADVCWGCAEAVRVKKNDKSVSGKIDRALPVKRKEMKYSLPIIPTCLKRAARTTTPIFSPGIIFEVTRAILGKPDRIHPGKAHRRCLPVPNIQAKRPPMIFQGRSLRRKRIIQAQKPCKQPPTG